MQGALSCPQTHNLLYARAQAPPQFHINSHAHGKLQHCISWPTAVCVGLSVFQNYCLAQFCPRDNFIDSSNRDINYKKRVTNTLLCKCVHFLSSFKFKLPIIFFNLFIPNLEIRISFTGGGQISAILSGGNFQDIARIQNTAHIFWTNTSMFRGRRYRWATSWNVAGWIPGGVTEIFRWFNPSGRTLVLGLT